MTEMTTGSPVEVALVFATSGEAIHWHAPEGICGTEIPDTRSLWEVLEENKDRLGGVAHVHPWSGEPSPSEKDVTTFAAIEAGLGKRLTWPIVTFDCVRYFWFHRYTDEYIKCLPNFTLFVGWPDNIEKLRKLSRGE